MDDETDEFEKLLEERIHYFSYNGKQIPFVCIADFKGTEYSKAFIRSAFTYSCYNKKAMLIGNVCAEILQSYVKITSEGGPFTADDLNLVCHTFVDKRTAGRTLYHIKRFDFDYNIDNGVITIKPTEKLMQERSLG